MKFFPGSLGRSLMCVGVIIAREIIVADIGVGVIFGVEFIYVASAFFLVWSRGVVTA